ncbi:unnamed protein product [Cylicocyclus nassatus]|uniref:Uncharacterized protein n=1 Tax=Cylicocyclus nassatus TaxID=53992 RepID=A0AA36GPK0_CYLNA|nr:unnamed protein product [Cylicocyclus nassatus]
MVYFLGGFPSNKRVDEAVTHGRKLVITNVKNLTSLLYPQRESVYLAFCSSTHTADAKSTAGLDLSPSRLYFHIRHRLGI